MWTAIAAAVAALAAFVALAYRRGWSWTGFRGKSLWDWMSLLVVPAGLALALFVLDDAQARRERDRAEAATRRAALVEQDRRRATLLSEYVRQMSDLVLSHGLMRARPDDPVSQLATTLTLTVLGQVDGRRKAQVLLFLSRARLLDPWRTRMDMIGADFRGLDARGLRFPWAMAMRGADFRGADFDDAIIDAVSPRRLSRASSPDTPTAASGLYGDFRGATFRRARLNVVFGPSDMRRADFSGAVLAGGSFAGCLSGARFRGAGLRDVDLGGAQGDRVDFRGAILAGSSLRSPAYDPARLSRARFDGARLGGFRVPPSWTRPGGRPVRCDG